MGWTSLRKGGTILHVAYGETYSNNLYGYEVRLRTEPSLELVIDLNPNLRTRNKSVNTCVDARELADGDIQRLKLVQLTDDYILKRLRRVLARARSVRDGWILVLELEGNHAFRVRPRYDAASRSLFLHVVG